MLATNIRQTEQTLANLAQQKQEIEQQIYQLIRSFNSAYGKELPMHLVVMSGRGFVWRAKASAPALQICFTFASARAGEFLAGLPVLVRKQLCEYEKQRAYLQQQRQINAYQIRILNNYCTNLRAANRLRR